MNKMKDINTKTMQEKMKLLENRISYFVKCYLRGVLSYEEITANHYKLIKLRNDYLRASEWARPKTLVWDVFETIVDRMN
jgi:hypothetical protein